MSRLPTRPVLESKEGGTPKSADPFTYPYWYAIQTHSWYEKRVRDQLTNKAITTFLPLWQQRRRWTDRVKLIELPRFGAISLATLRSSKVRRPDDGRCRPLGELQWGAGADPRGADRGGPYARHPPAPLRSASVPRGGHAGSRHLRPLAGVEGILVLKKSATRLIIQIELIHRAVAVDIDSTAVESLGW